MAAACWQFFKESVCRLTGMNDPLPLFPQSWEALSFPQARSFCVRLYERAKRWEDLTCDRTGSSCVMVPVFKTGRTFLRKTIFVWEARRNSIDPWRCQNEIGRMDRPAVRDFVDRRGSSLAHSSKSNVADGMCYYRFTQELHVEKERERDSLLSDIRSHHFAYNGFKIKIMDSERAHTNIHMYVIITRFTLFNAYRYR